MTEVCPICFEKIDINNFVRTDFCDCDAKYHKSCLDRHFNVHHNCMICQKNQNLVIYIGNDIGNITNNEIVTISNHPNYEFSGEFESSIMYCLALICIAIWMLGISIWCILMVKK